MVSAKLFALLPLFGALAAAAAPTDNNNNNNNNNNNSSVEFDLEPYKAEVLLEPEVTLWGAVESDLQVVFPGIQCKLAASKNAKREAAPNADCQTIEQGLVNLFPTIQCAGEIDWEVLSERIDDVAALEKRQTRTKAHVDDHHSRSLKQIAAEERKTITSCAAAQRPGNCRICVAGYAAAAVGEIGVCAAAAYGAAAASAGILTGPAWAAFSACGVAVIGKLGSNLTGCWAR